MNNPKSSLAIALTILAACTHAESTSNNCIESDPSQQTCTDPKSNDDNKFTCGLYLARSTIPNSGLGVFTGISHTAGSSIAPPEIAHQIFMEFNTNKDNEEENVSKHTPFSNPSLVHDYTWTKHVAGATWEGEVETLIPGLGMAANSFLPMANALSVMGSIDSSGVNFNSDEKVEMGPGSGAFSSYHGLIYLAEVNMKAGDEVFVNYGEQYFRGRPNVYGMVPLTPEFQQADEMMRSLWSELNSAKVLKKLMEDEDSDGRTHIEAQKELERIWNVFRRHFVTDERVRNALPSSVLDIPRAAMHGTAYNFLRGDNPRSLEWLETNGYCMDTLSIGKTTISHAGRGAFAKKAFVEGESILPLPMLQISRDSLDIWQNNELYSKQLLINYCFGHKDSSLLLFPYSSSANFINHGGKEANAKVVWAESDPTGFHQREWLFTLPHHLLNKDNYHRTGLLMLVVATRPISEGEEITIDYGTDWQDAWEKHVENWDSGGINRSAAELNESEKEIRTIFEGSYHPVATACHYRYLGEGNSDGDTDNLDPELETNLPYIEAVATEWKDLGGRKTMSGDTFRPCVVLARHPASSTDDEDDDDDNVDAEDDDEEEDDDAEDEEDGDTYTVQIYNRGGPFEFDSIPEDKPYFVKGIPRRAILFVDIPESSTQQYAKTFRHEIGVLDELWPDAWKDKTLKNFGRAAAGPSP